MAIRQPKQVDNILTAYIYLQTRARILHSTDCVIPPYHPHSSTSKVSFTRPSHLICHIHHMDTVSPGPCFPSSTKM